MKLLPPGQYNFESTESKILKFWISRPFYKPEYDPKDDKLLTFKEFKEDSRLKWCLICPPPNAYDRPHIGNLSGYAYMDAMGRYWRMKGKRVFLQPGKDHAGIEGEASFIKSVLEPQGKSRNDYTRDEFYQMLYVTQQEYRKFILEDERTVGLSADFERDLYTLDTQVRDKVLETFVEMYERGLIYKGVRLVNWDPKLQTALSDSQCVRKTIKGKLYTVKYPIVLNKLWNFVEFVRSKFDNNRIYIPTFYENESDNGLGSVSVGDTVLLSGNVFNVINVCRVEGWGRLRDIQSDIDMRDEVEWVYTSFTQSISNFLNRQPRGFIMIDLAELEERDYLTLATTRPETILADTAVAINPSDSRYSHLIGKSVLVPIVNRQVPIIFSKRVLVDFGTGVLKITPAHAAEDYEIMLEWNKYVSELERDNPVVSNARDANLGKIGYINIIDREGKLCGPIPEKYKGLKSLQAREVIVRDLENIGLLVKEEDIEQNVLISERTGEIIEPLMSSQWFVDVSGIKNKLIEVVINGELKIHPRYAVKRYLAWVNNLRDWAISRSLWWGYRLPVWYHGVIKEEVDGETGQIQIKIKLENEDEWRELDFNNSDHLRVQLDCPGQGWYQDEDILDTWFSSGQWPILCLQVNDLMDVYYPTDVLVSGYDLLIKWDLFMVIFGILKTGKPPFKDLYLTGLVVGADKKKMSKSRGNVIHLDTIKKQYGIDAFRMNCFYQNKAGREYAITYKTLESFRNFNNKIWNASKFVISNIIEANLSDIHDMTSSEQLKNYLENKKIGQQVDFEFLKALDELENSWDVALKNFRFGYITEKLYQSFWHYFCDKYIEISKPRLKVEGEDKYAVQCVLYYALKSYLKMLHPFIPFITEEIWQHLVNDAEYKIPLMYQFW